MPHKQFMLEGDVPISIYKRKANRSLRLSVTPTGEVRVSIPAWAPYSTGINFAKSRYSWILAQQQPARVLTDGQAIGKAHRLRFTPKTTAAKPTSRTIPGSIIVSYPAGLQITDQSVQKVAQSGSIRALRSQAEQLLPQRLSILAAKHDFTYSSISVKQLKSRWGSCDQNQAIVLNLFLMQLPWECIDYVLLHELMHTRIMRHGPAFWQAMRVIQPDVDSLRKTLKEYQPVLDSSPALGI